MVNVVVPRYYVISMVTCLAVFLLLAIIIIPIRHSGSSRDSEYFPTGKLSQPVLVPFEDVRLDISMPESEIEGSLYKFVSQVQIRCHRQVEMGVDEYGEGGWNVCIDPPFTLVNGSCLVYSFGILDDFAFDDMISKTYGCFVHAFDPSLIQDEHMRGDLIRFHKLGLDSKWRSYTPKTRQGPNLWRMRSLHDIRKELGHLERVIDVLKMDVDTAEFLALPSMLADGDLDWVKHLIFEIHLWRRYRTVDKFVLVYMQLLALELIGFKRYHSYLDPECEYKSEHTGDTMNACVKMYYLNTKYMDETWAPSAQYGAYSVNSESNALGPIGAK